MALNVTNVLQSFSLSEENKSKRLRDSHLVTLRKDLKRGKMPPLYIP